MVRSREGEDEQVSEAVTAPTSPAPDAVATVPAGARRRIEANLEAIRVVRRLEESGAEATAQDRAALAQWTSWGAVPQIFDEADPRYSAERARLHEVLDAGEWKAASRTTLNAHYTAREYTDVMWQALAGLEFTGGQVLEPGCGAGAFLSGPPASVQLSDELRMTGVELDPTTARIAQVLNPAARVRAESFASSPFADDTFDAVIGNVPFGRVSLYDPDHNAGKHSIHNHFIIKSLDLTRPGGLVAVLTSRYTLDAQNTAARREMFERADLVGAVRLPTGAHRALAGTDAVTDLVILRKRADDDERGDDSWVYTTTMDLPDRDGDMVATQINSYWEAHPEQVLGTMHLAHGMYNANTLQVRSDPDAPSFEDAVRQIVTTGREAGLTWAASETAPRRDADAVLERVARTGDISTFEGHLDYDEDRNVFTRVRGGAREDVEKVAAAHVKPLRELLAMRDTAVALIDAEGSTLEQTPDMDRLRSELNRQYDAYVAKYGPINTVNTTVTKRLDKYGDPIMQRRYPGAMKVFRTDPHRSAVTALENYDEKTGIASKTAIMSGRVIQARVVPTHADTAADALAMTWDAKREVDLDHIAGLLGIETSAVREQLGDLVFDDPAGGLVPAADYLSGDVRAKLKAAEQAVEDDPAFRNNVEALRAVLPRPLGQDEITARMGAVWISADDHEASLRETFDDPNLRVIHGGGSSWRIANANKTSQKVVSQWGTERMNAVELAERLMTQKPVLIQDAVPNGNGGEKRVPNAPETEAAKAKAEQLQNAFREWLWSDPQRTERLTEVYNDTFNSLVMRDYSADGQRLRLPGLVSTFNPHPHQRTAVARIISEPSVGLYHGVGAGKTAEMVMGAMELGRLGLVNKPLMVVPNHMLEQVTTEWLGLYPAANVLAAGTDDLAKEARRDFVAKAATGEWDGIVMTQTAFESLDVTPESRERYIDTALAEARRQLERISAQGGNNLSTKRMENSLLATEQRMRVKMKQTKDVGLTFEQTGIDYLFVDELHMYKNRMIISNIEGVGKIGSDRALDLDMKLNILRERAEREGRPPRVITGATATPIANAMSEAYVMQTYLRPDLLKAAGLTDFDAWATTFGESVTDIEMAPEGGFRPKTRFAKFNNLPELLRMWHISADVKTSAELALNVPELAPREDGRRAPQVVAIEPTDELVAFMDSLSDRAERIRSRMVEPEVDNMLKLSAHGRAAGMDVRLLPEEARPDMGEQDSLFKQMSKVDVAAERIHAIWQANRDNEYTTAGGQPHPKRGGFQIVFSDLGTPNNKKWDIYNGLRDTLVDMGMERSRIRFVHDANNDDKKDRLFADCRGGEVDVLIGSTQMMGVGTNIQTRAVALHHLDCPWRPADLEQRDGRIIRQGNQNPEVQILQYVTKRSFDAFMWQTTERKAKFIEQVMHGDLETRSAEDIETSQSFNMNEVKAIASDNPLILEKAQADQDLSVLESLATAHRRSQTQTRQAVDAANTAISSYSRRIPALNDAIADRTETKGDTFRATVAGQVFTERVEAANAIREHLGAAASRARVTREPVTLEALVTLGGHRFDVVVDSSLGVTKANLQMQAAPDDVFVRDDAFALMGLPGSHGVVTKMENALAGMEGALTRAEQRLDAAQRDKVTAEANLGQPFAREAELQAVRHKVAELERVMRGQDSDEEQGEPQEEVTTPVAPQAQATETAAATRGHQDEDESALWEQAWDEWETDSASPSPPRTQQQINAEGSQRVRDALAARHQRHNDYGDSPSGLSHQGPQMS